MVKISGDSI